MAGNKKNYENEKHKPTFYTLQYGNAHGNVETLQGNAQQIINHILTQQL